jgi:hypothetical protein
MFSRTESKDQTNQEILIILDNSDEEVDTSNKPQEIKKIPQKKSKNKRDCDYVATDYDPELEKQIDDIKYILIIKAVCLCYYSNCLIH